MLTFSRMAKTPHGAFCMCASCKSEIVNPHLKKWEKQHKAERVGAPWAIPDNSYLAYEHAMERIRAQKKGYNA